MAQWQIRDEQPNPDYDPETDPSWMATAFLPATDVLPAPAIFTDTQTLTALDEGFNADELIAYLADLQDTYARSFGANYIWP